MSRKESVTGERVSVQQLVEKKRAVDKSECVYRAKNDRDEPKSEEKERGEDTNGYKRLKKDGRKR